MPKSGVKIDWGGFDRFLQQLDDYSRRRLAELVQQKQAEREQNIAAPADTDKKPKKTRKKHH